MLLSVSHLAQGQGAKC